MCRYWRRANVRHGALWTQIFLRRGEDYLTTLLERSRASLLDIVTHRDVPATIISQISTLAQRIRYLEFSENSWQDVTTFSEFNFGQLPLLRTLKITTFETLDEMTPPSLHFFRDSTNLEEFSLHSEEYQFLSLFIFPNLTTFELSSHPAETFSLSLLLNFLLASPMLQVVKLDINGYIRIEEDVDMAVILPDVETFSLELHQDHTEYIYEIAAHIQCPCARDASLMVKIDAEYMTNDPDVFPSPDSWDTIVSLYATSSIEEVVFEIKREPSNVVTFSVTSLSPDASAIRIGLELSNIIFSADDQSLPRVCSRVFSQAMITVRQHPLVSQIKRLRIEFRAPIWETIQSDDMNEVEELFSSLGPLDKLTIHGCDLHRLLSTSSGLDFKLPHTKELIILHPWIEADHLPDCMDSIPTLAKVQQRLGIPFERVTIRAGILPEEMVEELKPCVGVVDCSEGYTGE